MIFHEILLSSMIFESSMIFFCLLWISMILYDRLWSSRSSNWSVFNTSVPFYWIVGYLVQPPSFSSTQKNKTYQSCKPTCLFCGSSFLQLSSAIYIYVYTLYTVYPTPSIVHCWCFQNTGIQLGCGDHSWENESVVLGLGNLRIQCWFQSLGETHLCYPFLVIKNEDLICTSIRYQQQSWKNHLQCVPGRSYDDMGSMVSQQRTVLWTNNNSASESGSQFEMIESMIQDEFWHVWY
jgi:hypothetical protein